MRYIIREITSNYAFVTFYKENYALWVEKQIAPNVANPENALWINEITQSFRDKLKSYGVPLAEPYKMEITATSVTHTCPFIGEDLETIIKKGKGDLNLLVDLIRSISGILKQETPVVGIDARLSNFCYGKNGIVYVDTFPPLVLHKKELLVHFPNPTDEVILSQEFKRKFEAFGILRRLRFSLLEQDSILQESDLIEAIRLVMGEDFAHEIENFFAGFLDKVPLGEAINLISLSDPDGIREVAIKYVPFDENRKKNLTEIFNLSSSYCPYNLNPEERLEKIKKILVT